MSPQKSREKPKYWSTSISMGKSLEQIRKMLVKYGADRLMLYQDNRDGNVGVQFLWKGAEIRIVTSAAKVLARLVGCANVSAKQKTTEHAMEVGMRLILNYLQNCFEMLDWEIMSPAEMFMPYLVLPGGKRILKDLFIDGEGLIRLDAVHALAKPKKGD